jgi:pyruvate kinase
VSRPSALRRKILSLTEDVSREGEALATRWLPWIERRNVAFSALNLAHYLALRKRDLRLLQEALIRQFPLRAHVPAAEW